MSGPLHPVFRTALKAVLVLAVGVGSGIATVAQVNHEALAQTVSFGETEITATATGRVRTDELGRAAWGLSETDWESYRVLMAGPSGLWYSRLAPAMVLGINARTEAERMRFARIVWEQEKTRLDDLFAFNRAYQQIARAARRRPGFSVFEERLLQSPLPPAGQAGAAGGRITAFVMPDCENCASQVRRLTATGRPFDVFVVGADSDREIRAWASRAGIPVARVVSRSITLNHASGNRLRRAGHQPADLPLFFTGHDLQAPVPLQALTGPVP